MTNNVIDKNVTKEQYNKKLRTWVRQWCRGKTCDPHMEISVLDAAVIIWPFGIRLPRLSQLTFLSDQCQIMVIKVKKILKKQKVMYILLISYTENRLSARKYPRQKQHTGSCVEIATFAWWRCLTLSDSICRFQFLLASPKTNWSQGKGQKKTI